MQPELTRLQQGSTHSGDIFRELGVPWSRTQLSLLLDRQEPSWARPASCITSLCVTRGTACPSAGCPHVPKAWLGAEGIPDLLPAPPPLGWGLGASHRLPRRPAAKPIVPFVWPREHQPTAARGVPPAQGGSHAQPHLPPPALTAAGPRAQAPPLTQPTAPKVNSGLREAPLLPSSNQMLLASETPRRAKASTNRHFPRDPPWPSGQNQEPAEG